MNIKKGKELNVDYIGEQGTELTKIDQKGKRNNPFIHQEAERKTSKRVEASQ